jgi:TATA-box binding protein (TBP) (component of TFIID and TFIIIB)
MADKKYESLTVENVVAAGIIADSIDLVESSKKSRAANSIGNGFPVQYIVLRIPGWRP